MRDRVATKVVGPHRLRYSRTEGVFTYVFSSDRGGKRLDPPKIKRSVSSGLAE